MRKKGGRKRDSVLAARIAGWQADHRQAKTEMHKPGSQQTERKFIGRQKRRGLL